MTQGIRLLVLEDDATQRKAWEMEVEAFNDGLGENEFRIDLKLVETADQACSQLTSDEVDAFVSDLRVPGIGQEKPDVTSGNRAVAFAVKNAACPVAVFSGYTDDFTPPFEGWPGPSFERSTDAMHDVFRWANSAKPMIDLMAAVRTRLRLNSAHLFHRGLWRSWQAESAGAKPDVMLRHLAAYLTEQLSVDEQESPASALEHYFLPSLRERLHTGDVVEYEKKVWVVVSAPCDLARSYPDHILLVGCSEIDLGTNQWSDISSAAAHLNESKKKFLSDQLNQNIGAAKHFLPPLRERGPWFAIFGSVRSVDSKVVPELVKSRLASMSPPFSANLRHRFVTYLGRPGQPALDPASVRRAVQACRTAAG